MLVVERNFAKFSGEGTRDHFRKSHEPDLWGGRHGEAALEGVSTVGCADPGPEDEGVARLKATVGLMKIEVVEFAMRSSARSPTWRTSCRCFRPATYQGEYPR
jgi:hypothetical protein